MTTFDLELLALGSMEDSMDDSTVFATIPA